MILKLVVGHFKDIFHDVEIIEFIIDVISFVILFIKL